MQQTVGRDGLLGDLDTRCDGGTLVTLVGPGGVGKTHLAHALLRGRRGVFVSLEASRSVEALVPSLVRAVGVSTRQDPLPQLDAVFAGGDTLLVVDNVEHLRGEASEVLAAWVARGWAVLATSRVPLKVAREVVVQVPPLDLEASLSLFAAASSGETGPAATEIVQLLGGNALAIELVAARTRVLSLEALRERVPSAWLAWRSRDRARPERHASVAHAVAWSWSLLSDEARDVAVAVSVFPGTFDLETAEAVVGRDLLEPILELSESSLLRRVADGPPVALSMFAATRAFARTQGEPPRAAHAREVLARVRASGVLTLYRRDAERLRFVASHRDDLVEAAAHLRSAGDADGAAEMVAALAIQGAGAGNIPAELARLEAHLPDTTGAARQLLQWVRMRCLQFAGRIDEARAAVRDAAALEGPWATWAAMDLVAMDLLDLQVEAALARLDALRPVTLAERALWEDRQTLVRVMTSQPDVAEGHARRAVALWEELGATTRALDARIQLARVAFGLGRDDVVDTLERALETAVATGDTLNEADAASLLALAAWRLLPASRTLSLHRQAIAAAQSAGLPRAELHYRSNHAECLLDVGELDAAEAELDAAAALAGRYGTPSARLHGEIGRLRLARLRGRTTGPRVDALLAEVGEPDAQGRWAALQIERAYAGAHDALDAAATHADGLDSLRLRLEVAAARCAVATGDARGPAVAALRELADGRVVDGSIAAGLLPRDFVRWHGSRRVVQLPDGEVDLSRKGPARRVFVGLVRARVTRPGHALDRADIFELGWPGQRTVGDSSANRVYTVIRELRGLGLEAVLQTTAEGYRLDPAVEVSEV